MPRIPNIQPAGVRRRRLLGLVALGASALAAALLVVGAEREWRLLLFAPFLLSAFYLLQAREKT